MLTDKLIKWLSQNGLDLSINAASGIPVVVGTDKGLVRSENQDRVAVMRVNSTVGSNSPFVVVALVDGMGGMVDGRKCAIHALSAFLNATIRFRHEPPEARLRTAAKIANNFVFEFSKGKGGATLSALLVSNDTRIATLNIGDSRIYATLEKSGNEIVSRLTVDDSLEEAVGGNGKELLQFIGMGEGLIPHVDLVPWKANRILITSDGVHFVSNDVLCEILLQSPRELDVAEELLTFARRRGAPDNASLAVLSLPKLRDSISNIDEAGIQFWDPYGELQVIWLKQEVADPLPKNLKSSSDNSEKGPFDQNPATRKNLLEETNLTSWKELTTRSLKLPPIKVPKKQSKKKPSPTSKQKEDKNDQLSIEIGPEIDGEESKGVKR